TPMYLREANSTVKRPNRPRSRDVREWEDTSAQDREDGQDGHGGGRRGPQDQGVPTPDPGPHLPDDEAGDEPAEVCLPRHVRHQEGDESVDEGEETQLLEQCAAIRGVPPVQRPVLPCAEEAEDRTRGTDGKGTER